VSGARVTITLGQDGMGAEADEADFDAWCAYVSDRIDEESGCEVTVETRGARDVQDDDVSEIDCLREDGYPARDAVKEAKARLWDAFCADASAWPS
jgi:hypothetical protein